MQHMHQTVVCACTSLRPSFCSLFSLFFPDVVNSVCLSCACILYLPQVPPPTSTTHYKHTLRFPSLPQPTGTPQVAILRSLSTSCHVFYCLSLPNACRLSPGLTLSFSHLLSPSLSFSLCIASNTTLAKAS